MSKAPRRNWRQSVVEELVKHIEAGTAPWQKPWDPDRVRDRPHNPVSGITYKGINALWLEMQPHADPRWMTYRQALGAEAQVRKGKKGTQVEYWKWSERQPKLNEAGEPVRDADGKPVYETVRLERPKVFYATVFNAEQIEGLEPYKAPELTFAPVEEAEKILEGGGVPIHHDQLDRAYYTALQDEIHLPPQTAFEGAYEYYATALHELGHATGHESRLNRPFGVFGSEAYAREELRAEMASFMISTELGLGHYPERHAAYVGAWLKAIEDDPLVLFRAARDAEAIRTWVMEPEKRLSLELIHRQEPEQVQDLALERAALARQQLMAGEIDGPAFEAAAKDHLGLDLPGDWTGQVEVRGNVLAGEGVVEAAGDHGRAPEFWGVYARRDDGTADWLADYKAEDEAKALAARLGRVSELAAGPRLNTPRTLQEDRSMANSAAPQDTAKKRIYLDVPYEEKEAAKKLGARWDRRQKSWFVREGVDLAAVARWMPKEGQKKPREAALAPQEEFAEALEAHGLKLKGTPQMDGKWHRVPVEGDRTGQLSGSYRGFLDGRPAGQIMNYKAGEKAVQWVATGSRLAPEELTRLREDSALRRKALEAKITAAQAKVAKRAYAAFMNAAEVPSDHPYLQKKQVKAHGLKVDEKGNLLVPMRDANGFLWNLQVIREDGTKRFLKGGRKTGLMHVIGEGDGPLLIAEGYATAASLHQAAGRPAAVAFDAGNLAPVAEALRKKAPERALVIAADDDHGKRVNAGLTRAREAAEAVKTELIVPPFSEKEKAQGLTDFNDLACARGPEALKARLALLVKAPARDKGKDPGKARTGTPMEMGV